MKYDVVIGLEVHVEMATESKLFCTCSTKFGAGANENVCPACAGMPGLLPVANKRAIELGMLAGFVTNSEITRTISFDKKNYFYPDLSTGYQITQLFAPICRNGYVDIETSEGSRRIRLKQIHIEEDAGKLIHDVRTNTSLVDYNRASVPLVEIVSLPDFRTSEEVIAYLEKLRALLTFAGVSDCKMQEGSMRADINISVKPVGSETLGTRVEIKNMNSLKAIARAIAYESERHIDALETGYETLVQETRRWDDNKNESFSMRSKENATDYRYFPNPDIMPIVIDDEWLAEVRSTMPELAHEKFARLTAAGVSEYDAGLITGNRNLSCIFDEVNEISGKPKAVAGWINVELLKMAANIPQDDIYIDCEMFAKLINLVDAKVINRNVGKKILEEVYEKGIDPELYVAKHNLAMVTDETALRSTVEEVLRENPKSVEEYKAGNQKTVGFFVGRIMKKTQGKADPATVNEILTQCLAEI